MEGQGGKAAFYKDFFFPVVSFVYDAADSLLIESEILMQYDYGKFTRIVIFAVSC